MTSLLRFLIFVAVASAAVGALYLWRSASAQAAGPAHATPVPAAASPAVTAPPLTPSSLPNLAAIDREFTRLVTATTPSVVSISAIPPQSINTSNLLSELMQIQPGGSPSGQLGAGAIVSEDGFIATNWHVIQNAGAVEVFLHDGRAFPAKFVGADALADVAILKIDATGLRPLPFADSDASTVGQMVFAVGNPFGLSETVTRGILSAKGRRTSSDSPNEFLQTDTPINPGNSGGPLVDLEGRMVGLNNSVLLQTDGIGFAIPANTVRRIYESIREHGRVIRPWLGVQFVPLTPAIAVRLGLQNARGALVTPVTGSPAARAGISPGDLVTSFNGRTVRDANDLWRMIVEAKPGDTAELGIRRGPDELRIRVQLEQFPGE